MTSTLHNAATLAQAVAITGGAALVVAYPVWRIRYARRTRQRYTQKG